MKHLVKFNLFEAVIIPSKIEDNSPISSFGDAVEFGKRNDFDVVEYDEFYNSLGEGDKKTAPPRVGVPFFALFHPIREKAMFVISDSNAPRFIPNFKEIMVDIIGHERVHAEQSRRKGNIEYSLPSPTDRKSYFSNKEEVMAFSFSISNDLHKQCKNINDAMSLLQKGGFKGNNAMLWHDIRKFCDEKTIRRYVKYIYMYLEKMFDEGNQQK